MYFLMICRHREGVSELRDELRPKHREHVATGGRGLAKVLTGSALWERETGSGIGNFGILEAETYERARAFAEQDPFHINGVVENVELVRLADTFQAQRIDPLTK
ncbi:YciI family protein [Chelativorans sp. J32]|uniref:YciI family protein n=1 Tax=Chelativorans sp. J32 TaxID=935840 RepID=UPI00048738CC|nr:YciI family protein [Chelativorans sp. J32]